MQEAWRRAASLFVAGAQRSTVSRPASVDSSLIFTSSVKNYQRNNSIEVRKNAVCFTPSLNNQRLTHRPTATSHRLLLFAAWRSHSSLPGFHMLPKKSIHHGIAVGLQMSEPFLHVLYASQTGCAQSVAEDFGRLVAQVCLPYLPSFSDFERQ